MSVKILGMKEGAGQQARVVGSLEQDENPLSASSYKEQMIWERSWEARRISVLPLWWRITHSSRWIAQVLASELSLLAFVLLLAMVFSEKWLCLSQSRFYQRWPPNVSARIHTSAHVMSLGLLRICKSKNCSSSEDRKDSFKLWANHPLFGVAQITFCLTLGLGFVFTVWLHLPYLRCLQSLPFFSWIGTIMSFCEVTFIFFTLLLFPINLWIFELKKNVSIPIGWSYFIGWLVFVLYVTCAALCHFNNKRFWSVITNCPRGSGSCSDSGCSAQNCQSEPVALPASVSQEEVPHRIRSQRSRRSNPT